MGFESTAQLIREQLHNHYTRTPIAWPNMHFKPPNREPWVRLTSLGGDGRQIATEGPKVRRSGVVKVQVFVPDGQGEPTALSIANEVAAVFEVSTIGGIRFSAARSEVIGSQNGWYQINVSIPFNYDD